MGIELGLALALGSMNSIVLVVLSFKVTVNNFVVSYSERKSMYIMYK